MWFVLGFECGVYVCMEGWFFVGGGVECGFLYGYLEEVDDCDYCD